VAGKLLLIDFRGGLPILRGADIILLKEPVLNAEIAETAEVIGKSLRSLRASLLHPALLAGLR
jgi:hypothetical protein